MFLDTIIMYTNFYRVDMFIRQQWTESRLIMPSHIFEDGDDYVTFPPQFFDNLWQPDPYFINSKVVGKINVKYINPNLP